MFATSLDVMYGVLSLCIIIFTGFLVWIMYYVAQILKQGNEVIAEIREKIAEIEEAVMEVKEKVLSSATSISYVAQEIGGIVDIVKTLKRPKRSSKKK